MVTQVDKEAYVVFYIAERGARVVNQGMTALKDAKLQEIDGVANKGNKAQVLFRANGLANSTTAHAGAGKGFYFLPEIGEEVLYTFKFEDVLAYAERKNINLHKAAILLIESLESRSSIGTFYS